MPKLSTLRPRLRPLGPRLGPSSSDEKALDRHRAATLPWRAWYKTAEWQRLRLACFKRDRYICQRTGQVCIGKGNDPDAPVANHKTPHRGDRALFFDLANLETVTKAVHDSLIQSEERRAPRDGVLSPGKTTSSGKQSYPSWFRPVYIPLTIVCGPPGSGKSTYVSKHAQPSDLVICFDTIASKGGPRRIDMPVNEIGDVLRKRNEMLGDLMRAAARHKWHAAWLIVGEPTSEGRQWWADRVRPRSIVVMETPADVCRHRIELDRKAGDERSANVAAVIDQWWNAYRPRAGDIAIRS